MDLKAEPLINFSKIINDEVFYEITKSLFYQMKVSENELVFLETLKC